jgi:hypothetical protein
LEARKYPERQEVHLEAATEVHVILPTHAGTEGHPVRVKKNITFQKQGN